MQFTKITVLDGIKNKLQDKNIKFHNGNDIVKLSINNESLFDSNFEMSDWGFNSITLKNVDNNKYLTLEKDDKKISSSADDIWGWFVKEVFKYNNINDNSFTIKTWDNEKISFNEGLLSKDSSIDKEVIINKEIIENGIKECTDIAAKSDVAIVVVGNHPLINGKEEIDRSDLILPPHQEELIKSVYSVNPNTIVVIVSSYPFSINWCNDNIPAILHCTHGCQEIGNAITKCLFGEYNPAGRLPMTWYKSVNNLPSIMNYDIINSNSTYMYYKGDPLYEFGYGLSYTNFKYSNLVVSSNKITNNKNIKIDVLLENIGSFSGDEVVQLYVSLTSTRAKRPIKQLINFERVHLDKNQCKWVTFILNSNDLEYFDVSSNKFILESGKCSILVGSSSKDIKLKKDITIIGETLKPRNLSLLTKAEDYDSCSNIILDECTLGGTCIRTSKDKISWIKFSDVDFKNYLYLSIEALLKSDTNIEIRIDSINGDIIGAISSTPSLSENNWNNFNCELKSINSINDLYLKINGDCLINSLQLF